MSIRALRTLVAIAESGSFAAAARALNLTESAVSMQMKALEDDLGLELFDRRRRPPVLTDRARALVTGAGDVLRDYDRLLEGDAVNAALRGNLRLGAVPSTITGILPPALALLSRSHRDVHIELSVGLSGDLVPRVERGALDAAIVSELDGPPRGLVWEPFLTEPLVVIAPLSAKGRTAEAVLGELPFIRYSRQTWVGQLIDRVIKRRQFKVCETMSLDTLEAVSAMVSHGLGASIVPSRRRGGFPYPVRIIALPRPTVERVVGLVHGGGGAKFGIASALLEALKTAAESSHSSENMNKSSKL
jgi:DNA-binding transcriptional LysR family regulator